MQPRPRRARSSIRAGRLGVFLYLCWSFFDCVDPGMVRDGRETSFPALGGRFWLPHGASAFRGPSSPCHGSPGDHKAEDTHLHTNLCYNTLCVNTANADVAGGLVRGEGDPIRAETIASSATDRPFHREPLTAPNLIAVKLRNTHCWGFKV